MGDRKPWGLTAGQEGWERFEEAAYEYAQECTFMELEKEGYVGPPGDISWTSEYMPAFFEYLDKGVLEDVLSVDSNYVREEAQYHFMMAFRDGWRVASGAPSEEAG
jgi:hypothetical protein